MKDSPFILLNKEHKMKLTPPKNLTFWVSVLLAVLGLVGAVSNVPVLSVNGYPFWLAFLGYVVLVLGLLLKGF